METSPHSLEGAHSGPEVDTLGHSERTQTGHQRLVHELFEEQVERAPEVTAVVHGGRSLNYRELNVKANQLARFMVNQELGPDQLVGICLGRGLSMITCVLGVLKAGAAYIPLDPNYPLDRLRFMLEDAAPRVVLTQDELQASLPKTPVGVIAVDHTLELLAGRVAENLPAVQIGVEPGNLVYVIYTSGSTGRPKGTAMPHRAMGNLIEWHRSNFAGRLEQRVLQYAALSFDVAFQEIFTTLCTGGTLVLLDEWIRRDMHALSGLIRQHSVQRLFLPPMVLQALGEYCKNTGDVPATLQDVITAGEQLRISTEIMNLFREIPGCRLHNHYGPTETHVVSALTLSGDPSQWPSLPSIGRPIRNTTIYLLDSERQPVPQYTVGEIYIGGIALARGYLGRPDLTEQRFVADLTGIAANPRLYRTGDMGRWRRDGTLEYLGRNDDQVKVRGFRIELGEVEAQLVTHPDVKEAAVVLREDTPGDKRLVAYLTLRSAVGVSTDELRAHLNATLPQHMVPSAFVTLPSFPLTPNGKLDRRALPGPSQNPDLSHPYEAPEGELEGILANQWQELLHLERVGRNDNFFEIGGNSLLILQMVERLRQLKLRLEALRVYEKPTLAALAAILVRAEESALSAPPNLIPTRCRAIEPEMLTLVQLEPRHISSIARTVPGGMSNIQDIYPLAPLQEGLLFHHLLSAEGGGDTYVLPMLIALSSPQRLEEFAAALQAVIDRHDILRTAVLWEDLPQPIQVVYRQAILPIEELSLDPRRSVQEQLLARMRPDCQRVDLSHAPMVKLQVAADPGTVRQFVLLQIHHLAGDHESVEVVLNELAAHLAGRADELPPPMAYRNHVALSLGKRHLESVETFFRSKLADIDEPTAPFGLLDVHADGTSLGEASQMLPAGLAAKIGSQARRLAVSPATLFHAAWALVVAQTSARDDIVFGTLLLGRLQHSAGAQRTLGMFINTLPLRLRLKGASCRDLLERTQRGLSELLGQEQASLAVAQRCSGLDRSRPVFTTLLNYRHSTVDPESQQHVAPGVDVISSREWTNYPLALSIDDLRTGFRLTAQTDRRIEPKRVLAYVCTAMESLLTALAMAPDTPALSLSILSVEERHRVVQQFNATTTNYPDDLRVEALFEAQVARAPQSAAVTYQGCSLSYADLNSRANQVAHYLVQHGVRVGDFVPIIMPRSLQMLVATLAVLKSGGAYVPIDPNLPFERQLLLIRDCAARCVIAEEAAPLSLQDSDLRWINTTIAEREINRQSSANPGVAGPSSSPAYVMFTSGSTGTPKGVVVAHRGISRLVINCGYAQLCSGDCIAHCSNPSFDASTFEIWAALLHGARLLILPQDIVLDGERLANSLIKNRVSVLFLTTALFNRYASTLPGLFLDLRCALFGGEICDANAVRRLLRAGFNGRLLNIYGPTEATAFATYQPIDAVSSEVTSIPIGRPISNTQIYILDSYLNPVPIGVPGEIYIGGPGVALGYLNQPHLTAERFIADPFNPNPQARLYKSGDRALWQQDGTINFLGRADQQIKLRGFRIELSEIETQLLRHEHIKEVLVLLTEPSAGDKRLIAYLVPTNNSGLDPGSIADAMRVHLKAVLPEYMVPSAFVLLKQFPLTPNGKLDRSSLPAPDHAAYSTQKYEPLQGEIERSLGEMWERLLGVSPIGRNDNFFELGGHSLLATQLIVRIRSIMSVDMAMRALFESPTLQELARKVEAMRKTRLGERVADGGSGVQEALRRVASMPEAEVKRMLKELSIGGRQ